MKTNPEWYPYLNTLEKAAGHPKPHVPIAVFITNHPKRLQPAVALGLALTKWYLNWQGTHYFGGTNTCGCCVYYLHDYIDSGGCNKCPLMRYDGVSCIEGSPTEIYNRILKAYTKAFNALPDKDRRAA